MMETQAFLPLIGREGAQGELREIYEGYEKMAGARPAVYSTPGGDAANIIRAHSLDPEGLSLAFAIGGAIHWGPTSRPWAEREMINTVTSRVNNCFY